jgi:hypothetical protein
MDAQPDVIRNKIEDTRESLTQKLETLEGQVKETITTVTSTVEETIDTVKSTVEDTVEAVKQTFDIPEQVRRHPYGMTGGALLVGTALGYWMGGRRPHAGRPFGPAHRAPAYTAAPAYEAPRHEEPPRPSGPGLLSSLLEPLSAEFGHIRGLAIGALMGAVRDAVKNAVPPSLAHNVEEILDNITRRAGGEVVQGPVLPPSHGNGATHAGPVAGNA